MAIDKFDNNEDKFELIGLDSFFNNEIDKNVDWEEFFQLSNEEQFYAMNNNQIIEDDKSEDQKWSSYIIRFVK